MFTPAATRVAFIGSGAVGKALAVALARTGVPVVAAASRTAQSAHDLAATVAALAPDAPPVESHGDAQQAAVDAADCVFITTFDGAIAEVSEALSWRPGQGVVHCSGATTIDALAAAEAQGAVVGSLHPLQAFASDVEAALEALPGSTFGIEARDDISDYLEELALSLGGRPLSLRSEDKALYHATVVTMGGVLQGQLAALSQIWSERFGVDRNDAAQALIPIVRGCADVIAAAGFPDAMAGLPPSPPSSPPSPPTALS